MDLYWVNPTWHTSRLHVNMKTNMDIYNWIKCDYVIGTKVRKWTCCNCGIVKVQCYSCWSCTDNVVSSSKELISTYHAISLMLSPKLHNEKSARVMHACSQQWKLCCLKWLFRCIPIIAQQALSKPLQLGQFIKLSSVKMTVSGHHYTLHL